MAQYGWSACDVIQDEAGAKVLKVNAAELRLLER